MAKIILNIYRLFGVIVCLASGSYNQFLLFCE
jgi:hypothetical protein